MVLFLALFWLCVVTGAGGGWFGFCCSFVPTPQVVESLTSRLELPTGAWRCMPSFLRNSVEDSL